jgi:hypothetical protein
MPRPRKETADTRANGTARRGGKEESISGYFRRILEANPALLDGGSNQEILDRWLRDHPGHKEVPPRVRQNFFNVKSVLRGKRRKAAKAKGSRTTEAASAAAAVVRKPLRGLEALEAAVDDCLAFARSIDREVLAEIIALLRRARNEVVCKMG